ncbi:hypothetical protein CBR_g28521 [Chara braunii]|uniref:RRM domain-containing protein n=1 Tax=Chara braunii TaxID=69332 RepID=A0A388JW90_CHABU|nr:hypothetical protein CBR_g28521 [Chara braunii]|eukprot:GBG62045.1 hypothetical protein CBR_g28521 [Chara braunii]
MGSALDMSLDDLIKSSKTAGRGAGRGGGRGAGRGALGGRGRGVFRRAGRGFARGGNLGAAGPIRRVGTQRGLLRAAPYSAVKNDLLRGVSKVQGAVVRTVELQTGTKLYISNLDFNVSNDDIKELFSEVGDLKRCSVHFDRSGRSKGSAEVVFARRNDALTAVKRYNNVLLDGKPMKIDIIGTNVPTVGVGRGRGVGATRAVVVSGGAFRGRGIGAGRVSGGRGRGGRVGAGGVAGRGRGRGGRGRGRGDNGPTKTAEELDAELDSYHAEAMQP